MLLFITKIENGYYSIHKSETIMETRVSIDRGEGVEEVALSRPDTLDVSLSFVTNMMFNTLDYLLTKKTDLLTKRIIVINGIGRNCQGFYRKLLTYPVRHERTR